MKLLAGILRTRWFVPSIICAALVLLSVFDHLGVFGYSGSDWHRFDRQSYKVARCIDGDTIVVASSTGEETVVHLLGVDAPDPPASHWAQKATKYTNARATGRSVTLRLEAIQSRSDSGELLAYIFITDGDCLNQDVIRDGQAYADRRVKHSFAPQFQVAENEARKKPRGLWIGLTDDQMPQWRREWLKSLRAAPGEK